jgi:hypothetical protein
MLLPELISSDADKKEKCPIQKYEAYIGDNEKLLIGRRKAGKGYTYGAVRCFHLTRF